MFTVSQEEAQAVQKAFHENGEWAAVVELRRFFHIQDNDDALNAVRAIARWQPLPERPSTGRRSSKRP